MTAADRRSLRFEAASAARAARRDAPPADRFARYVRNRAAREAAYRVAARLPWRTWEESETRYPRLMRALRWAACLTTGEAACVLRDWPRIGILYGRSYARFGGCEAVLHFGGPREVLRAAVRCRHVVRDVWRERRETA